MEERFLADVMLGKLSKWLRILGYDTHFENSYGAGSIDRYVREGRILLTRKKRTADQYSAALFIRSDHVKDQLHEMADQGLIVPDTTRFFTRCLKCNTLLRKADSKKAQDAVPEYIYYHHMNDMRFCPSCESYFWPGTHREKMARQLVEWGLGVPTVQKVRP